jgi:hypothetical protein
MIVQSFLVQGAAASVIAARLGSLNPASLDGLVLMSLRMDHEALVGAVKEQKEISCPVFLTETYGILGFVEESGKNIELMEKGRGSEYGFRGGSGGQRCLAIGFSDAAVCGSDDRFPDNASSLMVIADLSGSWKKDNVNAPLHYCGITKTTWKLDNQSRCHTFGSPIRVEHRSEFLCLMEKLLLLQRRSCRNFQQDAKRGAKSGSSLVFTRSESIW